MENIFLAIVSDDREYGKALGLALLSVCRSFIIRLVSPSQMAEEWKPFDLVLFDKAAGWHEAAAQPGNNIIYLTERPEEPADRHTVYKYLPARSMVPALFEFYEALTGRQAVNLRTQDVSVYGFVSWAGGAGCTLAAAAFGRELCRYHGRKVLYLSLEEIESSGNLFECCEGVKNTGEYLYHLFKGDGNAYCFSAAETRAARPFLEAYMLKDDAGLESFAPAKGRNPLKLLDAEEFMIFLSSLMDSGRFDTVVMDIGSSLDEAAVAAMTIAGKLCMIKNRDGDAREGSFMEFLKHQCGDEVFEKVVGFDSKSLHEEEFSLKIRDLTKELLKNLT